MRYVTFCPDEFIGVGMWRVRFIFMGSRMCSAKHGFWTDLLADLHVYEPTNRTWTDLSDSMSGSIPSRRFRQGFAAAGGQLYLFGGIGWSGV